MEVISTEQVGVFVGKAVLGKAVGHLVSRLTTQVIDRCSRRRIGEFVETFCTLVVSDCDEEQIRRQLDEIVNDDRKSEALFDAYRRVALSVSPILGPRIIALVMAKVIAENRQPSDDEERFLSVSERLSDTEFREARKYFEEFVRKCEQGKFGGRFCHEPSTFPEEVAGIDLWNDMGSWAAKLADTGFISRSIGVKTYRESYEGNGDEVTNVKLTTDLYYLGAYEVLADLIRRAEELSHPTP